MATTTITAGEVGYWEGSRAATSGIIASGITGGGTVYCCYFSLNLANIPAGAILSSAVLHFTRSDTYTSGGEGNYIGIRTSKPDAAFNQSSFNKTLNGGSPFSIVRGENTLTISAADLTPYIGQTIYICICAGESGYCYVELNKTLANLNIVVSYQQGTVFWGVNGSWKRCLVYYGVGGQWKQVVPYWGVNSAWKQIGG